MGQFIQHRLAALVQLRQGEGVTAAMMFAYSFLAMTSYNIVKPITRSKFISDLGADNLPWVQLGSGLLIGLMMHGYSRAMVAVPKRWAIPVTQAGLMVLLVIFWALFSAGFDLASVGFYVLGQILGILLISQFWTLANDVYDARHAKRLFGLIGGGASVGGATGAAITAAVVKQVGTVNLLLVAAVVMLLCLVLVVAIVQREERAGKSSIPEAEAGVGSAEAIGLLKNSRHLQLIAVIIGCAAIGGAIVEQQLNMAAAASLGQAETDGITQLLAQVTVYLSLIGFVIQVGLTSRIHGLLGIGFALLILPVSLGGMGALMLLNTALWVPAAARVLDTSLRYTVDKTTREILFLPLPASVKYRAKPFIDVTTDRFAKAGGALLLLVLIKPWGLALTWQQLSYASLVLMAIWMVMALRARREYLAAFRQSIARHEVAADDLHPPHADLQTVELLVEELSDPDDSRVLYAIDLLESLGKKHLVTPLLLHHSSAPVRARTLRSVGSLRAEAATRWLPAAERLLTDDAAEVRIAAARTVAIIRGQDASDLMRGYLEEGDPRLVITADVILGDADDEDDREAAAAVLERLVGDSRQAAAVNRCEIAKALADVDNPRLRQLLVTLILDSDVEVARAAIGSASRLGPDRSLYLPALVSLLRESRLTQEARAVILAYGDEALEFLAHRLRDEQEDTLVRRHIPETIAQVPTQRALDFVVDALSLNDGLLRYQSLRAIEALRRANPRLALDHEKLTTLLTAEIRRCFNALTLHANIGHDATAAGTLLDRALIEKQQRTRDRVFRLLALLYPDADIAAAWCAIRSGDGRQCASASEYLDNVVTGPLRRRILLMVDDMPEQERVRQVNVLYKTRPRDVDDTLAQLIHDEDAVIAATAIQFVAKTGRWSLADDIEFALSHRSARDWYVFEAASWALAGRDHSREERQEKWREPLSSVELADQLRRVPMFDYVSVDELFRFAGTARQVRYERGRALYRAGLQPNTLEFLMEGEVQFDDGTRLVAPGPLAFEEMLEGSPIRSAVHAVDLAVTLSLTQDEFLTLLGDNIEVAKGLFRMLVDTRGGLAPRALVSPRRLTAPRTGAGLLARDRMRLLHENTLFAAASPAQLIPLAAIAREVPLHSGAVLASEADNPVIYFVVRGALAVARPGTAPVSAHPGDAVGLYEALAGIGGEVVVTVAEAGTALRIDGKELFELLASDMTLLRAIFSGALRAGQTEPVIG